MKNLTKTLLLILVCILGLQTQAYAQTKTISTKIENGTLSTLIKDIESKTNYTFFINEGQVDVKTKINNIAVENSNIEDVLTSALSGTDYYFQIENRQILVKKGKLLNISGTVVDSKNEPVIGATVLIRGEKRGGTVTDIDGKFDIKAFSHNTLSISYLGFNKVDLPVNDRTVFNVTLKEDSKALEEVVVTALGIKREEKSLGYSVTKVDGKELTKVKGVNVATSMTGKIAGVNIQNSTEFGTAPTIKVRGSEPFVVIDGVPYGNVGLNQVPADDIADINILKGPTASALYGARAENGVIMITTKRGADREGLDINVNSNTMFNAGHLRIPEAQTSYSSGTGGKYNNQGYVWGDKMDIGREVNQYNPLTQKYEVTPLTSRGKDNLKNFMQQALVTNNNVSVGYKSKNANFRSSLSHVYNRGQFPNLTSNKMTFAISGDLKIGHLKLDAALNTSYEYTPQSRGAGYGVAGHIYNIVVWNGAEYDIRDYRNYWLPGKEDEAQNWWHTSWYDNPYLVAYERTDSQGVNRTFGQFNATYDIIKGLKAIARVGYDTWSERKESQVPMSTRSVPKGSYSITNNRTTGLNGDLMLTANYTFGSFNVDGLLGGSMYCRETDYQSSQTENGLKIPGYYSLLSSVGAASTSSSLVKNQINSLYGKVGLSWNSAVFVDVTGRNDWTSVLSAEERSYFYPSVGSSVVLSEFMPREDWGIDKWFDFWKVRASWTISKTTPNPYWINNVYDVKTNIWDGLGTASYPTTLRSKVIKPQTKRSWEVGTAIHFFKGRLNFDFAYYQELTYNMQRNAALSPSTGFSNTQINIGEELLRKGYEFSISGDIIKNKDFVWNSMVNWSQDRYTYNKIDLTYSTDLPWVKPGMRWDWFDGVRDWERDPQGNVVIYSDGMPRMMNYKNNDFYTSPDWIWGFSNNFTYKDFALSFTFDGRVGGYAWDRTSQAMFNAGSNPETDNQWRYEEVVNGNKTYIAQGVKVTEGSVKYDKYGNITEDTRKFAPNDKVVSYETYIKTVNPYSMTYQNIKKADYIKLRELSLGYNVPKSFCGKMKMDNMYVALVGQNLWMWSKNFKYSDPEYFDPDWAKQRDALTAPSVRYIGINVKLGF